MVTLAIKGYLLSKLHPVSLIGQRTDCVRPSFLPSELRRKLAHCGRVPEPQGWKMEWVGEGRGGLLLLLFLQLAAYRSRISFPNIASREKSP